MSAEPPQPASTERFGRVGRVALPLGLVGATAVFAWWLNRHYPLKDWLFWRYASYWTAALYFAAACTSFGHFLLRRSGLAAPRVLERLYLGFVVGVLGFELAMFLLGLAGLYGKLLFFALPLALGAPGALGLGRDLGRVARRARRRATPLAPWKLAIAAFGLVGLLMVLFLILTPENVQFDARWKHLALAEDYAASGGVRRFPEGWTFATRPHMTSFLYGWAFLMPRTMLFDRIELAAHLEYVVFLVTTLVGLPALVRRLVSGADARIVWVARFLFPGVLLYDSSLTAGADHVAAMYGPAIFLVVQPALARLEPRRLALLGALFAGVVLTKESAAVMLVPAPVLAVALAAGVRGVQSLRGRAPPGERWRFLTGPLAATAASLIGTAPLWLTNWIWHGNPVYPLAARHFSPTPWTADASYLYRWGYEDYQFSRPPEGLDGLWATAKVLGNFSFVPNDYDQFHGDVPVFGSLFTLLLVALPWLVRTRRIWAVALWIHLGVTAWYWVHHQDRYLQALVPLMAAVAAATIVLIWRTRRVLTRLALGALLGLQVIWGGDVYFIQTHAIIGSPIKRVVDLLESGYKKKYKERLEVAGTYVQIRKALPPGARLLRHENHEHLGMGVPTVDDWATYQFGISYGLLDSPRQVHDLLRSHGVTHLTWIKHQSRGFDSLAGDLRFFELALLYTTGARDIGNQTLAALPEKPPEPPFDDRVLLLACPGKLRSGLYRLADLRAPAFGPDRDRYPEPELRSDSPADAAALARDARFAVLEPRCPTQLAPRDLGFLLAANRKAPHGTRNRTWELWVKALPK